MSSVQFTGTTPVTYTQWLNEGARGHTLTAQPGGVYSLAVADQWQGFGTYPGDGRWVPAVLEEFAFGATPGLAVSGGATPGEPSQGTPVPPPASSASASVPGIALVGQASPGRPQAAGGVADVLAGALEEPQPHPLPRKPVMRVLTGRRRDLRPAPRRRRTSSRTPARSGGAGGH